MTSKGIGKPVDEDKGRAAEEGIHGVEAFHNVRQFGLKGEAGANRKTEAGMQGCPHLRIMFRLRSITEQTFVRGGCNNATAYLIPKI